MRFSFLPRDEAQGAPEWALTYADLMTLLLVFFVAMVAYSKLDADKYRTMVGSFRSAFGTSERPSDRPSNAIAPAEAARVRQEADRIAVEEDLAALAARGGKGGPLQVIYSPEGVRVRIQERLLFGLGSAGLHPGADSLLLEMAPLLRRYPHPVQVEGHTDDLPIQTAVYPSNWELSAARAGAVVRLLVEEGGVPADRLAAVGYAETRPLAPNDVPEERAQNRRVEFLLTRPAPVPSPATAPTATTAPTTAPS